MQRTSGLKYRSPKQNSALNPECPGEESSTKSSCGQVSRCRRHDQLEWESPAIRYRPQVSPHIACSHWNNTSVADRMRNRGTSRHSNTKYFRSEDPYELLPKRSSCGPAGDSSSAFPGPRTAGSWQPRLKFLTPGAATALGDAHCPQYGPSRNSTFRSRFHAAVVLVSAAGIGILEWHAEAGRTPSDAASGATCLATCDRKAGADGGAGRSSELAESRR